MSDLVADGRRPSKGHDADDTRTRVEECRGCRAELHACRMCEFYDTSKAKHCRETIADEVKDKQSANFCDYFKPTAQAYRPEAVSAADKARAELEALFGRK